MANLRVRTIDESELDTVLAEDFSFDGTINFDEPLVVKGHVSGELKTESDLYVAESATLDANVKARRISLKGTLHGDVNALERIEIFSGATLQGNIETPDVIIQSGSHFTGRCVMPAER